MQDVTLEFRLENSASECKTQGPIKLWQLALQAFNISKLTVNLPVLFVKVRLHKCKEVTVGVLSADVLTVARINSVNSIFKFQFRLHQNCVSQEVLLTY